MPISKRCPNTKLAVYGTPDGPLLSPEQYAVQRREDRSLRGKAGTIWCPGCGARLTIANAHCSGLRTHFRHKNNPDGIESFT